MGWLEHVGIDLLRGTGRLAGERRVEVDGRLFEARHAVIVCTGTSPLVPDLPGLRAARPWTNREATTSRRIPDRLAILGGGAVACELAVVYAALGSTVTVIEQEEQLLGRTEAFAAEAVAQSLRGQGVDVRLGARGHGGLPHRAHRRGHGRARRGRQHHRRRAARGRRAHARTPKTSASRRWAPRPTTAATSR